MVAAIRMNRMYRSLTIIQTYSSLHKTKCQPSTSSTPCRTKRGLDEHTASSESSREAMETSQADINGSGAADRLTGSESVDVKRSRTDREKGMVLGFDFKLGQ